jgi:hypothetical protein
MDNEKDKEIQEFVVEKQAEHTVEPVNLEKHEADDHAGHSHDDHGHGGHGHGHDESEPIVLHQEKLLPTMLLATCLVIVTLFGLYAAGGTKMDIRTGKAAFDKIESEKIMLKNSKSNNMQTQTQQQNSPEEHKPAGAQVEGTVQGH